MRPAPRALALALAAVALAAAPAAAKAPKPSETPTVEEIYRQARQEIEDAAKREIEKAKDPLKEAIDSYRDRKTPLEDYQQIVDVLNNTKDEKVQDYRPLAADALVVRFQHEEEQDPRVKAVRRDIAEKILNLMVAPKGDAGLPAIERILYAWWKAKMTVDIRFKYTDPPSERKKALDRMRKFLKKGDN